jgi:predicted alpha-1,2-mannosidase
MASDLSRRTFGQLSLGVAGALALRDLPAQSVGQSASLSASRSIHPIIGASTSQKLGEGKTFPGATVPFGMVQISPDTITGGDNAPGYSWEHTTIEGFSFTHMSGVGWYGDFGNLQIMPTTGVLKLACGRIDHPGEGWRSRFSHATERAEANYYAVTLQDSGIRAEMTAAPRSAILRFTYPQSGPQAETSRISIDLARRIGGTSTKQYVRVVDNNAIEGWMHCPQTGGGWGDGAGHVNYTLYFRLECSRPPKRFGAWKIAVPADTFPVKTGMNVDYFSTDAYYELVRSGEVLESCREAEGTHLGFYGEFSTTPDEPLLVKAGISFVSMEGARANLQHDIPGWDFDAVRRAGVAAWDEALAAIVIEGASEEQQAIFATAMYHAMIDPRVICDADGSYVAGDGKVRRATGHTPRTIFSGWDVFRAEMPLMMLIRPQLVEDMIASLVELADLSGKGYLERWEIMNAYSGCMDGDPATAVIVDAYAKGLRGFDVDKAYRACRQTAAGSGAATNRPENDFYLQQGWVPELLSWSMDNWYYDWCVSRFATMQGNSEDAKLFAARAQNYRKLWDPEVGSMRAKTKDGAWIPWKGKTVFGQGCVESNPGQQSWFVPHDVPGLIQLMGGKEAFAQELEQFFEHTPDTFGWNDYYNHSNEPVHHVPYLFVYAGKPWLTQKWARRICKNGYKDAVDGIVGNDDVGQMSAWYVMSAFGLYPVCPGDGIYVIGSPLFEKATMRLDPRYSKHGSFTVVARGQSADNVYVQSAKLNGQPLDRAWLRHQEVMTGETLELVMGPAPNEQWGSKLPPPSGPEQPA